MVVGDAKQRPDFAGALGNGVDELLRRHFSLGGGLRDFLTVLVHPDQEMDIVTLQAVIAGNRVGADLLEGMALVGIGGGVIDCRGEVVLGQLMAA